MSEARPNRADAQRHLQAYLDRIRASGVDWLPGPNRTLPMPASERMGAVETQTDSFVEAPATLPQSSAEGDRRIALAVLAAEVKACQVCGELAPTRTQTVFGVGPMNVDLCFIGEAPGADEDRQGEPFVGAAGQLLTKIIVASGFKREEVYICNILKCRPPGNRQPKPDEAANCRPFLDRQLALIQPKFICCLGASASQYLLKTSTPIGKLRGKFYAYQGIPVLCTYHPASLLPSRSPQNKKLVWDDMKMLLTRMGRPIPPVATKD